MKKINRLGLFFLLIALASISFAFTRIGLVLWFKLVIIFWFIFFFLYFFTYIFKTIRLFFITFLVLITFTILLSNNLIPGLKFKIKGSSSGPNLPSVNGIKLSDCTKTINDKPQMLSGWKVTIFSAPLLTTGSNDVKNANDVKTFSFLGIKNKTDPNSINVRFEKSDGGYITGAATTIEVCNQNNKANYNYVTKYRSISDVASSNAVASINFFHGGAYLFGDGTYRVDAYIRDQNNVWQLVDRMTDIKITE